MSTVVAEVSNNIMNRTNTCPHTTDRHHERPSQGSYQLGRGNAIGRQWSRLATQPAEKGSLERAPSHRHKAAANRQTAPKGVNG